MKTLCKQYDIPYSLTLICRKWTEIEKSETVTLTRLFKKYKSLMKLKAFAVFNYEDSDWLEERWKEYEERWSERVKNNGSANRC